MKVPCVLIKRLKQHFINLECNVGCIIGNNGYIWVTEELSSFEDSFLCVVEMADNAINSTSSTAIEKQKEEFENKIIKKSTRLRIAKVVRCIMELKYFLYYYIDFSRFLIMY